MDNKRFQVIADYPGSPFIISQVITLTEELHTYYWMQDDVVYCMTSECFLKYPAIFRLMEWWEDLPLSALPDYVLYKKTFYKVQHKYSKSVICFPRIDTGCGINVNWESIIPATEDNYINSLKYKYNV